KDKKILFIHIPKCAGVSIEGFFDWKGLRHETLQTYADSYSEDFLESCFKFTVIRNPWDRMVSWYFYHNNPLYEPKNIQGFQNWVKEGMQNHWKNVDKTNWTNKDPLSILDFLNNNKNIDLNYIGKVETLDEDMKRICEKTNTKYKKLPKKNTSKDRGIIKKHYSKYYDEETKNIIRNRFSADLSLFPYEF
ncbi:hypothetical protein CMI37_15185, partial [Candidatus Pacearchaeota archaeon]|nr:hypothetical protein [Candidatus Pacearchaeota archaeon]